MPDRPSQDAQTVGQIQAEHAQRMSKIYDAYSQDLSQQ
jgi:hypothetical protein